MSNSIQVVSLPELSDIIDQSVCTEQVDLGSALLVFCSNSVMGDVLAISTTDGRCAVVKVRV